MKNVVASVEIQDLHQKYYWHAKAVNNNALVTKYGYHIIKPLQCTFEILRMLAIYDINIPSTFASGI